ncbi:rho guanine nucleotide exchange factor 10-like protein [Gigantopelta aegis]|uniref:rho guanine nucleotide exchange factor 10-like protein n=1 Tax=Gigantopelta aegis TaxID=1735272 RepID=UPI001B88DC37|nr:rho guanine nucleotide exchange factor 10-like protein [Gigantopelta aegis]
MTDDHNTVTSTYSRSKTTGASGDEIGNKLDRKSRPDSTYNDATSGISPLYSLDDIDDGDGGDVYTDCASEVDVLTSIHHRGNHDDHGNTDDHGNISNAAGDEKPVYFVLEDVKTTGFHSDVPPRTSSQATVEDIAKAFDSSCVPDAKTNVADTNTFENNFIADHDIPKLEDPFSDFTDVEKCDPIYDVVRLSGEAPASSGGGAGSSESTANNNQIPNMADTPSGFSIYEIAGPSPGDTSYRPAKRMPEPIYEIAAEPGALLKIAKQTVADKSGGRPDNIYSLASAVPEGKGQGGTLPSFMACKQGVGRPVSVQFLGNPDDVVSKLKTLPTRASEDGLYDRLKLKQQTRKRLKRRSLDSVNASEGGTGRKSETGEYKIYEDVNDLYSDDDDDGWGSSEFEEYSDNEDQFIDKPLPPKPKKEAIQVPGLLNKVNLRVASLNHKDNGENGDSTRCFPVTINPDKHPPPELPPLPDNLSENQKKRRCVIDLTIASERSYIDSLHRITQDYEKTVLSHVAGMKSHARIVFLETHQLLSHHKMFQIELSDKVARWDVDEKIGDIFTASFSRSMLVDSYSTYVNSFAAAMEEIKSVQRMKPTFSDFLRAKEHDHSDRLSLFGLMVKPVQRFPQFIMLLQDLLKYTPRNHHDRVALQLALTELENVTHQLNERKRRSEQQFLAHQITSQVIRQINQIANRPMLERPKRLIRQDNLEQVVGDGGQLKMKDIRLILMDDTVLCAKVGFKEHAGYVTERYKLKWVVNLQDLEIKDSAITSDMKSIFSGGPEKFHMMSSQIKKPHEDPFNLYADLRDMLHDHNVLTQIRGLVATLKRPYQGLTEELLQEFLRDLQQFIRIKDEQLQLVNSCTIILSDVSKNETTRYVFQTQTPKMKHDWCMDFLIAKLALEKQNNPGWDAADCFSMMQPTYFMKCLPVDVPRNYTKMKCVIPVFHSSGHLGVQYLWICSTTPTRGQVAIVSIHNIKPSLVESFKAADSAISCTELVLGYGVETEGTMFANDSVWLATEDKRMWYVMSCTELVLGYGVETEGTMFSNDSVWLATEDKRILVFLLINSDGMKREAVSSFPMPAEVTQMKYLDDKVFCGLMDGRLAVITRDNTDASWNVTSPVLVNLGIGPVVCLQFEGEDLWAAIGTNVHVVDVETFKVKQTIVLSPDDKPIDCIVRTGVGLWVSYRNSSVLQLYHVETLVNLQEINIASSVLRLLGEKSKACTSEHLESCKSCTVTSLSVSKGILWIGTSPGFILTLPLPRLRDGVPLASGRPNISLHSHRGPVKFLLPIYYSSSVAEFNRSNSLWSSLRKGSKVGHKLSLDAHARSNYVRVQVDSESKQGEGGTGAEVNRSVNTSSKSGSSKSLEKMSGVKRIPSKSKTLSFRSELVNKIAIRASAGVNTDLIDDDEIKVLYEHLLESDNEVDEELDENNDGDDESTYDSTQLQLDLPPSTDQTKSKTKTRVDDSTQFVCRSSRTLPRGVSAVKSHTMHGTMKKNTCNSVIVMSGGDGYCDWNKPSALAKVDDASLLLWIYKI